MRYAVSAYTFDDAPLPDMVSGFADLGFDTMSFTHRTLLECPPSEAREAVAVMDERDLAATVHAQFDLDTRGLQTIIELLGPRIECFTFDQARWEDSRGTFFDTGRMVPLLAEVAVATAPLGARYAVEDFPLDAAGLEYYRAALSPLLTDPRLGVLIDLGHLNLRRHHAPYFADRSIDENIAAIPLPIIEVHVHDNKGHKDDHAYLGFGDGDFPGAARALKAAKFDGVSTIELCAPFYKVTCEQARQHAQQSLDLWRETWAAADSET